MERKLFAYANIASIIVVGISMLIYTSYFESLPWHHAIEASIPIVFMVFIPILLICGETVIMLKDKLFLDNINPSLPFIAIPFIVLPVFIDPEMSELTTGLGSIFSMIMLALMALSFLVNMKRIKSGVKAKMYRMKK